MDILAAVETSYDRPGTLASNISTDQLGVPAGLPGWDVRTLLDHTLGFIAAMTDCGNGAPMAGQTPAGLVQNDPTAAVQRTVFNSLATWRRPGALDASHPRPANTRTHRSASLAASLTSPRLKPPPAPRRRRRLKCLPSSGLRIAQAELPPLAVPADPGRVAVAYFV